MNKVFKAINSYKIIEHMDLAWLDILNICLTKETKAYIENGNIPLHVLAILIRDTMLEYKSTSEIDTLLWSKLHNRDLITRLVADIVG